MLCKQRMPEICTTVYCAGLLQSITLHLFLNPAADICHPFFFFFFFRYLSQEHDAFGHVCIYLFICFLVTGIMQRCSGGISVNWGGRILEWVTEKPPNIFFAGSRKQHIWKLCVLVCPGILVVFSCASWLIHREYQPFSSFQKWMFSTYSHLGSLMIINNIEILLC